MRYDKYYSRRALIKRAEFVYRNYDVSIEEYRTLNKMIFSDDEENNEVARALLEELVKRPQLYKDLIR